MLTPKILIVRQSPSSLSPSLSMLMADASTFDAVTVRTEKEALREVGRQNVALILIVAEPTDGLEMAQRLHAHEDVAATPLILVSEQAMSDSQRLYAYRAGAVDVLCPPLMPEVMQVRFAAFVELARHRLQLQRQADTLARANEELQTQRERDQKSIRERKRAEDALRQSREELRQLASYQDRVKEDERKRIAREIHDELGQNLLALRIDVSMLEARTGNTHPKLNRKVHAVLDHIDATMKAMRSIINNLRPTVLDLGLNAAIEWQVKEFQRRAGVQCQLLMGEGELALDDTRATALFRILQESLNNVLRHARATKAEVALTQEGGILTLRVSDNGIGMFPDCRRKTNTFGLIGIKERISALGGTLRIETGQDSGTSLIVSMPVEGSHQEEDRLRENDIPEFSMEYAGGLPPERE